MIAQSDREIALYLLAAIQAGQNVMEPEPEHVAAIVDLLEDEEDAQ